MLFRCGGSRGRRRIHVETEDDGDEARNLEPVESCVVSFQVGCFSSHSRNDSRRIGLISSWGHLSSLTNPHIRLTR